MLNMAQPIKISDWTTKLTRLNGLRTCVYERISPLCLRKQGRVKSSRKVW
jgi:hypothetical protein